MERAEPTDKQAKQLTIVLAENLQEDLNDSIVSRYLRVYKNHALTGTHQRHFQWIKITSIDSVQ